MRIEELRIKKFPIKMSKMKVVYYTFD